MNIKLNDTMGILEELSLYIFCYNHCIVHDSIIKNKMIQTLEDGGIRFVKYKGKIYFSDFVNKNNYFTDYEKYILSNLAKLVKEVNEKIRYNWSLVYEAREVGFYFKNIKDYWYLEKCLPYELITNVFDTYYNKASFFHKLQIKQIYNNYKKNV